LPRSLHSRFGWPVSRRVDLTQQSGGERDLYIDIVRTSPLVVSYCGGGGGVVLGGAAARAAAGKHASCHKEVLLRQPPHACGFPSLCFDAFPYGAEEASTVCF
jgi:hypothetical protein